jgi:hypothetical protein
VTPSPTGWHEVPCVECGKFAAGIGFVERCAECLARRKARAAALASRAAVVATILMAAWSLWQLPHSTLGRWYAGVGTGATFFLVRLITGRIAMEVLP